MHMLQDFVTERSGKRLCLENSCVKVLGRGAGWSNLRGHDESGPVMALKLLVGPRWREFHCLAAPPLAVLIEYGL